ncbi:transposase [Bradyrhizobium sp. DN5]|uniref:IS66 family transposase n=1 Tax=Bradyrhizobium sp. DN5 TaxID=3056950 RepID=UPI003526503C
MTFLLLSRTCPDASWAHGRHKFFDLARLSKAPIAAEAIKRVDVLFAIEREINGLTAQERLRVREARSRPVIVELEAWLREQRQAFQEQRTTKAINYCLSRRDAFSRFFDNGRLCMSNDAAERELRAVAVGRNNWTFAGFNEGGRRAATIYSLIATALCRARHRAVYAARQTMPSRIVFPRFLADQRLVGSA